MIIFDGDSTLVFEDFGIPKEKSWPHLVAQARGHDYLNLATQQATAYKCRIRTSLLYGIDDPTWYVLQVGQWSSSNELLEDFNKHIRGIIEAVRINAELTKILIVCMIPYDGSRFKGVKLYLKELWQLSHIYNVKNITIDAVEENWFIPDTQYCHISEHGSRQIADQILADPRQLCA